MSKVVAFATLALAAVSTVSGLVIPRNAQPSTWATGYLEDYNTYHTRYMALNCESQHGQQFFDDCCHPMLATETLAKDRKSECTPDSQAYSSAMAAKPTSTVTTPADDGDGDDCDESPSTPTVPASSSPSPVSSPVSSPTPSPPTNPSPSPPSTPKSSHTSSTHTTPTPSSSPSSSSSSSSSSSGDVTNLITGGFATFFYQNGVAGACGTVHSDSDLVAAMDQERYGNSGGKSSLCGKQVKITNTKNNKSVVVTVADDCPTCTNKNSIDLSVGAFLMIATLDEGEVPIEWDYL